MLQVRICHLQFVSHHCPCVVHFTIEIPKWPKAHFNIFNLPGFFQNTDSGCVSAFEQIVMSSIMSLSLFYDKVRLSCILKNGYPTRKFQTPFMKQISKQVGTYIKYYNEFYLNSKYYLFCDCVCFVDNNSLSIKKTVNFLANGVCTNENIIQGDILTTVNSQRV